MKMSRMILATLIVIFSCVMINWVRGGDNAWHIVQSLPLLGGYRPSIYDVAGFVMLLILVWGIRRMKRNR